MRVLTPVSGDAATASWPCSRSLVTSFDPMSPVPPMMTSFMIDVPSCVDRFDGRRRSHHLTGVRIGAPLSFTMKHQELGRRGLARVSADDVHVVRSLVEGLTGPMSPVPRLLTCITIEPSST